MTGYLFITPEDKIGVSFSKNRLFIIEKIHGNHTVA